MSAPPGIVCYWRKLSLTNEIGKRCSHSASLVGSLVWVIGGAYIADPDSSTFVHCGDVHTIDFSTGESNRVICQGDEFSPRRGHSASVYLDRYIIIFGGVVSSNIEDGNNLLCDDLFVLDTKLKKITRYSKEDTGGIWPILINGCSIPRQQLFTMINSLL